MGTHEAIVMLWAEFDDGTGTASVGTGCFVTSRHVLTAAHVVEDEDHAAVASIEVRLGRSGAGYQWAKATVAWRHPDRDMDVALLVLDGTAEALCPPVEIGQQEIAGKCDLSTAGYPVAAADADRRSSKHVSFSGDVHPEKDGEIQLTLTATVDPEVQFGGKIQADAWQGASGMPVLARIGDRWLCIGVVAQALNALPRQLAAVPIRRLLEDKDFARLVAPQESDRTRRIRAVRDHLSRELDAVPELAAQLRKLVRAAAGQDLVEALMANSVHQVVAWLDLVAKRAPKLEPRVVSTLEYLLGSVGSLRAPRMPARRGEVLLEWLDLASCRSSMTEILMAGIDIRDAEFVVDPHRGPTGCAGLQIEDPGSLWTSPDAQHQLLQRLAELVGVTRPFTNDPGKLAVAIEARVRRRLEDSVYAEIGERDMAPFYLAVSGLEQPRELERLLREDLKLKSLRLVRLLEPEHEVQVQHAIVHDGVGRLMQGKRAPRSGDEKEAGDGGS